MTASYRRFMLFPIATSTPTPPPIRQHGYVEFSKRQRTAVVIQNRKHKWREFQWTACLSNLIILPPFKNLCGRQACSVTHVDEHAGLLVRLGQQSGFPRRLSPVLVLVVVVLVVDAVICVCHRPQLTAVCKGALTLQGSSSGRGRNATYNVCSKLPPAFLSFGLSLDHSMTLLLSIMFANCARESSHWASYDFAIYVRRVPVSAKCQVRKRHPFRTFGVPFSTACRKLQLYCSICLFFHALNALLDGTSIQEAWHMLVAEVKAS